MSNINNLTSKILDEAKAKSDAILKAAEEEAAKIIAKKVSEAKEIEKEYIDKANQEAFLRRERILSSAELKARNEKLEAKQLIIEKVLSEVIGKLNSMSKDDLLSFIKKSISSMSIDGDEKLIVSSEYKEAVNEAFIKELNDVLISNNKKGNLTLSSEERSFGGGFILEKKGIEINNTFEALVQSMKDELEYEVARVLFS